MHILDDTSSNGAIIYLRIEHLRDKNQRNNEEAFSIKVYCGEESKGMWGFFQLKNLIG